MSITVLCNVPMQKSQSGKWRAVGDDTRLIVSSDTSSSCRSTLVLVTMGETSFYVDGGELIAAVQNAMRTS